MTGGRDAAWIAGLADTLAGVDEFLRSPQGHAALQEYHAACGRPGFHAGNLIDAVGFTGLWLRAKIAPRPQGSLQIPLSWPARRAGQALPPSPRLFFSFLLRSETKRKAGQHRKVPS